MIQTIPSGWESKYPIKRFTAKEFHPGTVLNLWKFDFRGQYWYDCRYISSSGAKSICAVFYEWTLQPLYKDIELNDLKRNISVEPAVETCIRLIERFFMQRLVDADCNYQRTQHAIRQIINQPQIDVKTLAESTCLGYRQFKRVFTNYVGMSPKEYYRVVRFQRALYLLQNHPGMELVDLAYSCGFYDSSHLVKDFKEFTGCSPTQYLSSRSPYSTFFSEDCRLNVTKSHSRA